MSGRVDPPGSMPNSPRRGDDDQPRGTPRELLRTPHPPVAGGLPALLRLTTQQVIARLEYVRIVSVVTYVLETRAPTRACRIDPREMALPPIRHLAPFPPKTAAMISRV